MNGILKNKIKQILSSNPDSIIFYHEYNEWSIYHPGKTRNDMKYRIVNSNVLLDGNDYRNKRGFAPELVVALAEMLGIRVKSNTCDR